MKVILGEKYCGKTSELIRLAYENSGYIVCDYRSVGYILRTAEAMKLLINKPVTYWDFINGKDKWTYGYKFYIDDVENLLSYIANGGEIDAYTTNTDKYEIITTVKEDEIRKIHIESGNFFIDFDKFRY